MKVAIVAGFAPSLIGFRGPLLQALVAEGHEVFACAAEDDVAVAEVLRGWKVAYQTLPLQRTGLNPLRDRMYHQALRAWLSEIGADVVLAYTHKPVIYAGLAAGALLKRPRVYPLITGLGFAFIGNGLKARLARFVLTTLYRRAVRNFSGVFFQNLDDQTLFQSLGLVRQGTPKLIVRGSGVDLAQFPFTPLPDVGRPSSVFRFLLIARLLADKGIREYVAAARIVKATHPAVEFHLIGPTDPNPAAIPMAEIVEWQREGMIIYYHGAQKDIRPFLRDCTVYVLPSYREGTPRTVLEAMATGRAVITTDAPGCRETVFNAGPAEGMEIRVGENGLMVPVKSADALAAAMRRFIDDPNMAARMGVAGRRLAEEHYDVHKVNRQMLAFMALE